jgi:hypothetical protein
MNAEPGPPLLAPLTLDELVTPAEVAALWALAERYGDGAHPEGALTDALSARLVETWNLPAGVRTSWQVVRRAAGPALPAVVDSDEAVLARAHVFLDEGPGGDLRFPRLAPARRIERREGRTVTWRTTTSDGRRDLRVALAQGPLRDGEARALAWRAWDPARACEPAEAAPVSSPVRLGPGPAPTGRAIVCVVDPEVPDATLDALRAAAKARGLAYEQVVGASVDPRTGALPPGSLLYRAGVSWSSSHAEALLYGPGVATFYTDPAGPLRATIEQDLVFERAGLPVPRFAWIQARAPEALPGLVEWLGGFPLVVKVPGGEGGVGTLRADSLPGLTGLLDWMLGRGERVRLSAFVPDAMHWRLVVVGERVVTAYRNPVKEGDFRSAASSDPADYGLAPPAEAARIAVAATKAQGVEFAGVDVLVDPRGSCYLLEANFPCFFAQATLAAGIDVAGPMLDHLLTKVVGA